ncbi:MAG: coenzyme F420-0:L-glutamate ligase [Clostridia bacterium]|nr:coenzyme F420-0:L-glutamate ligase [Clostridia bacterium]
MRSYGTCVYGVRTPVIKSGDDLASIVVDSVLRTAEERKVTLKDRDVVAITEAVVGISQGNYATVSQIGKDIQNKFGGKKHIGIVFPTPVSRNRFSLILRGIANGAKKVTILMAYPEDEVGNNLFDEELLYKYNINPWGEVLTEEEYDKYFGKELHVFTGVNYVKYFREIVENEGAEAEIIFSNRPTAILDYTKNIIVANIHKRERTKKILAQNGAEIIYKTDGILCKSVDGSGYNSKYGLLGSNKATEDTVKLFPEHGDKVVETVQKSLFEKTGKKIEVMIYGDGAFKDPVGGIWELADPVVSPAYTSGLEGTPNELKLKYIADNDLSNLKGEALANAMRDKIKNKADNLKGTNATLGTTPRRYTDLLGSLSDLTSGSGDKGTPVVLITGYFDNYATE